MGYEKKDMSGTLFRNDKREKDSHPNAQGTAIIEGIEYWVSAWTKDGAKGKFQSLSFKRKDAAVAKTTNQPERKSYGNRDDSDPNDLPF